MYQLKRINSNRNKGVNQLHNLLQDGRTYHPPYLLISDCSGHVEELLFILRAVLSI